MLEPLQGLARLDPELVDERLPRLLVGGEGVGLPVGAVEGEHLLGAQALTQRMLADEHLQLAEHVLVAAEREIAVDPVHQRGQPQLVELRDLVAPVRLERETGQRRAAPERERLPQELGSRLGLARCGSARGAVASSCARVDVEAIGRRPRAGSRRPRSRSGRGRCAPSVLRSLET